MEQLTGVCVMPGSAPPTAIVTETHREGAEAWLLSSVSSDGTVSWVLNKTELSWTEGVRAELSFPSLLCLFSMSTVMALLLELLSYGLCGCGWQMDYQLFRPM